MRFTEIKLPFGLNKNNTLVHIADVENGKKCECVCPECHTPLIAANRGSKIQPHFKHAVPTECEGGLESTIHRAAKQIISERKSITFSQYELTESKIDSKGNKHTEHLTVTQDGMVICFDSVDEEIELHGMKADIVALTCDRQLIIEIFYRHKVDAQKREKITKANISAIEIDLSNLIPEEVKDWEAFWLCINDSRRVKWLHNAKAAHHKPKLVSLLQEKLRTQEEKYKQDEIEKREKEKIARTQLLQALENIKPLCSKEHIEHLKQQAETHPIWKYYSQYLLCSLSNLPDFINVNVTNGDWIFGCDRRMWQMAFFISFIYNNGKPFCIERVDEWLQNERGCKVPSSVKLVGMCASAYRQLNPLDYILNNTPSSWQTLRAYFNYLCDLGILEFSGGKNGNYWYKIPNKNPRPPQQYYPPNWVLRKKSRL